MRRCTWTHLHTAEFALGVEPLQRSKNPSQGRGGMRGEMAPEVPWNVYAAGCPLELGTKEF